MKRLVTLLIASGAAALVAAGCSSDSTASRDDPTTRAMSDPMGYAPAEHEDISGGGMTDFNSEAFKKDMNHVLNP